MSAGSGRSALAEDDPAFTSAFYGTLGTALAAPGMDKIRSDFERPSTNRPDAWNKGAMLACAKVPGNWLGVVARNNALDDFAEDHREHLRALRRRDPADGPPHGQDRRFPDAGDRDRRIRGDGRRASLCALVYVALSMHSVVHSCG